jgi:hypothetical protein
MRLSGSEPDSDARAAAALGNATHLAAHRNKRLDSSHQVTALVEAIDSRNRDEAVE